MKLQPANLTMRFLGILLLIRLTNACSDMPEASLSRDAAADGESTLVLQFVPSEDTEYQRQEAPLQRGGYHYRMRRSVNLQGMVLDPALGKRSASVRLNGALAGGKADPASVRAYIIDATEDGFLARVVPGSYIADIIPNDADLPAQRQYVEVDSDGAPLELRLSPGTKYSGYVTDSATNLPIAGASVRSFTSDGRVSGKVVSTDATGYYQLTVGPEKSELYRLEFSVPDKPYPRVTFDALPATSPTFMAVKYLAKPLQTVTGKIIDAATRQPAESVTVTFSAMTPQIIAAAVREDTGKTNSSGEAVFSTQTDAAGNFSVTLPKGDWTYSLSLQPPIDRSYGGIFIASHDLASGQTYELSERALVGGRVNDYNGEPVAYAEVVVTKTLSLKDSQQVQRVFTDENGDFEIPLDRSVSAYDVTIIPTPGHGLARCTRSAVNAEGFGEAFVLHKGIASSGYIEDENGSPLAHVAVTLAERPGDEASAARVLAIAPELSNHEGRFELVVPADPTLTGCRSVPR